MNAKQLITHMMPIPILNLYGKMRKKKSPKYTQYKGASDSVLQCIIAYNKYGGYCVPLTGYFHFVPQTIFKGNVWEQETTEFIVANLGSGDIIHAGTFFGDSLPAIANINNKSITWAFEPNPESYRCASITKIINNLNNVRLFNKGLGEHHSLEKMKILNNYDGQSMGGGSRMASKAKTYSKNSLIDVEVVAIDEIIPHDRKIDIIHLDIEGFEKEALTGATNTIKRCKPILIIESLPDNEWVTENILNIGYRIHNKKINKNTVFFPI